MQCLPDKRMGILPFCCVDLNRRYAELYPTALLQPPEYGGRAVWGMGSLRSLERWDRGFESH
jgi:hypothetical protein